MTSHVLDPERLEAVKRARLVDTEREAVFDELTRVAAQLLEAPFAFMTAVDQERSFWKSTYGIADGTRANRVEDSFCQYVIETEQELIVGDAAANELTRQNPSIESMGVQAWAGFPVEFDGHILGTFCVVDQRPREWTDAERETLRGLAALASKEIELRANLRAAEAETDRVRGLLATIRSSLLPPSLPDIAGLSLAAWFAPASDSEMLLGDFYDVFALDTKRWGVVIGDVCGHGVEAAKLTSLARYSMRAAAVHHDSPADVLAEVDEAIRQDRANDRRFVTACYMLFDMDQPGSASWARGGHTLPILRVADGSARVLNEASGPPLGAVPHAAFEDAKVLLDPGDTLLLYTDGVTECRDRTDDALLTEEGLVEIVALAPRLGPQALVDHVVEQLQLRTDVFHDDLVLLAIQRDDH